MAFPVLPGLQLATVGAKGALNLVANDFFVMRGRVHTTKLRGKTQETQKQTKTGTCGYVHRENAVRMIRTSIIIFASLIVMSLFTESSNGKENKGNLETATFGGGCFWCTEAIFERLKGVESAESGYSGGHVANPTYQQVCTGETGHAEVIQVRFDPSVISFTQLLKVFFKTHDPTTLNRQGADVGTQYRSVIFYHDDGNTDEGPFFHGTISPVPIAGA